MSKKRSQARSHERGGTIMGFMAGLIFGLSVAVFVAIFVTRAPVPFVNRVGKTSERVVEPKSVAEAPDPNKPLYSKSRNAPSTGSADPGNSGSVNGGILNNPENKAVVRPAQPAPVAAAPATAPLPAAAPDAKAEPPKDEKVSYTLQAGAFKSQDDADNMKARLALVGYEARILTADVNGQTLYRVRVGPYVGLEDMNKARVKLAESGIEASVIRQK